MRLVLDSRQPRIGIRIQGICRTRIDRFQKYSRFFGLTGFCKEVLWWVVGLSQAIGED